METTGLDGDSEIVEITIIDLDENPLFETLIKPVSLIPEEAPPSTESQTKWLKMLQAHR
ncbi:hypothetical protein ABFT51_03665 [Paenibacillus peoriae]|uniref:hypothetical protein n=1 Tax=Paenibacillus peoriae TaxID=59893 RepID=UPI0032AEBC25